VVGLQIGRQHTFSQSGQSTPLLLSTAPPVREVESLSRLIEWFQNSSLRLMQEYRRLETRVSDLDSELAEKNCELKERLREREEARGYLLPCSRA